MDLLECLLPHLNSIQLNERAGEDGFTALHTCADMGAARTALRLLCDERVDTAVLDKRGRTAQQVAELAGHHSVVEALASRASR